MEQVLFIFGEIIALSFLYFGIFGKLENNLKALFAIIAMVLFAALAIQSLNIEIINLAVNPTDTVNSTYVVYRIAEHSNEYMFWMALNLIMFVFSFLKAFIAITYKPVVDSAKGLEIPQGFPAFRGVFAKK